jgi:hypothetical protein
MTRDKLEVVLVLSRRGRTGDSGQQPLRSTHEWQKVLLKVGGALEEALRLQVQLH